MRTPARRTRRGIVLALAVATVTAMVTAPGGAASSGAAAAATTLAGTRPNIVLLLTDDQSIAASKVGMPYLQRGIAAGDYVNFTNAEVNNSLCCPSRGAILSGQVDTRNGVLHNSLGPALNDSTTAVVALDQAGYRTGLIGKYFNGYSDALGRPAGWDDFQPVQLRNIYTQYDYQISNNGTIETYGSDPADYMVDVLADKAETFLNQTPVDQPFFLMVTPTATHGPFIPAPRHQGAFASTPVTFPPNFNEANVSDKPQWVRQLPLAPKPDMTSLTRKQWTAGLAVDDMLRALEANLAASGRLDNTVVVVMSDNGLANGAHRHLEKRCEFRECAAVPLAVRYPGQAGRTDTRLVSNTDLAPTFLALAGAAPLTVQDGVSQVRVLEDPTGAVKPRTSILGHWVGGDNNGVYDPNNRPTPGFYSLRQAGWRYVEVTNTAVSGGIERELYNQVNDPYELKNRAAEPGQANRVAQMQAAMYRLITASGGTTGQQGTWSPGAVADPAYRYFDDG